MDEDVLDYFASIPDDRQEVVRELHKLIMELCPTAIVDMTYRMPTYKSGNGWVALANQKHYVSLYTCGAHDIVGFKRRYPNIKTGKGCINLKPGDPLPLAG